MSDSSSASSRSTSPPRQKRGAQRAPSEESAHPPGSIPVKLPPAQIEAIKRALAKKNLQKPSESDIQVTGTIASLNATQDAITYSASCGKATKKRRTEAQQRTTAEAHSSSAAQSRPPIPALATQSQSPSAAQSRPPIPALAAQSQSPSVQLNFSSDADTPRSGGRGRQSGIVTLAGQLPDGHLTANGFTLVDVSTLTVLQRQRVPAGFTDDRVPVCSYCFRVVVGKVSAYTRHSSTCEFKHVRIAAQNQAAQRAAAQCVGDLNVNIAVAFVRSGSSVSALHTILKHVIGFTTPLATFYPQVWDTVAVLSTKMLMGIASMVSGSGLTVAIDAGISSLTKQHMLVAVVCYEGRGFLLPPACQASGFSGADIGKAMDAMLSTIGRKLDDVQVWISDGCKVNGAFFNILDQEEGYIQAAMEDPPEDKQTELLRFLHQRAPVYCRGHWINVILRHAQAEMEAEYPAATAALKLFNQGLYNAPGRGRRVKEFIQRVSAEADVQEDEHISTLHRLLENLYSVGIESTVLSLREHVDVPDTVATNPKDLEDFINTHLAALAGGEKPKRSNATAPVTLSKTRWMANRYQSVEYFLTHFDALCRWVVVEANSYPTASVNELASLLGAKKESVRTELQLLLCDLEPIAEFLKHFSEETPYQSILVHSKTERLKAIVTARVEEKNGRFLRKVLDGILTYRKENRNDELWAHIRWFIPSLVSDMKKAGTDGVFSTRTIFQHLHFSPLFFAHSVESATTLMSSEIGTYLSHCEAMKSLTPNWSRNPEVVANFWRSHAETYPLLSKCATTLLNIPAVVTGCDSVFSADANLFTSRRLSTSFDNGMRQLALKYNINKWKHMRKHLPADAVPALLDLNDE